MSGTPAPAADAGIDRRLFKVIAAHFMVDCYTNAYAPLLPLLIPRLQLSLVVVGTLAMLFQLSTSVSQLAFGRLADRWRPHWLLAGGPILAVVVMSCIGLAPGTWWLAGLLLVGGLGGAAFHPPGAMAAYRFGGRRTGLALSLFVGGGSVGFAIAPVIFSSVAAWGGLRSTWLLMIPGLAILAWVVRGMPEIPPHAQVTPGNSLAALRPYAKPLALLYSIVVLRTIAALAFVTFVPVLLTRRGVTVEEAGIVVTCYLFGCAAGGFVSGPLADRWGPRRVIAGSLVVAVPLLVLAPRLEGLAFAAVLTAGGFFLQSTQPVSVAFAQTVAPVSAATVSSLMMGGAWGTGGLLVPFIGLLADRLGVGPALTLMALVPLAAAACALPLPDEPRGAPLRDPESAMVRS
jgi:FSR family fosmidomycin resistance protein-like MFS transporter